jgi:hypothetical protein
LFPLNLILKSKMIQDKKVASLSWICLFIKLVKNDLFLACLHKIYRNTIVFRLFSAIFGLSIFFVQTRLLLNQKKKIYIYGCFFQGVNSSSTA